jgi:hypothetical protein
MNATSAEVLEYEALRSSFAAAARGAAIRIDFGGMPDLPEAVHKLRIERASLEDRRHSTRSACAKPARCWREARQLHHDRRHVAVI